MTTTYKLIVIGNSNTGKSSLINRYINDKFSTDIHSTIGIEFTHKDMDDQTKLSIWDSAGQERFQSVGSALYNNADVVMFVYDVTNMQSFHGLEHWYRQYITYGQKDAIKIIVGNKIDLNAKVSDEMAKSWAVKRNMMFETASAKSSDGVHKAFATVISQLNKLPRVQKEKIELKLKPKSDRCCY